MEVWDDGPGVEPAVRARVFDPYFTTEDDGTGLGLAIVKKVVLEHGDSIDCGEAPEGGAAFRIRLPVLGSGSTVSSLNARTSKRPLRCASFTMPWHRLVFAP